MRALIIDEEARAKVAAVEAFADCNWYRPGMSETVPGDDPRHTITLGTYRCVFSYTLMPNGGLFRHLSVSVPSEKFPHQIADLFGFTGWDGHSSEPPASWMLGVNQEDHCIVLAQEIKHASHA
jgi:hypothetical protein